MATSSSTSERESAFIATALIFSGRRDPQWRLSEQTAAALTELWRQMEQAPAAAAEPPGLGYRGCTVDRDPQFRWHAYGGVVSGGDERKHDPQRRFERFILESAPAGAIPPEVLKEIR
jgi:hypothetical protein